MLNKRIVSILKSLIKPMLAIGLAIVLMVGQADAALAARSGGRMGGGSFRMPSRGYSAPRTYRGPSGGGYNRGYPAGGGFGSFFLLPFFTFGGGFGGLFTVLIVISLANFLMQTLRRGNGDDSMDGVLPSKVTVAKLQVGLLADARSLKTDLNRIAESADTDSGSGRAKVLQETMLALLRHPEYWAYASTNANQISLSSAEAQFNQLVLAERSKFTRETLSNVNGQRTNQSSGQSSGTTALVSSTTQSSPDSELVSNRSTVGDEYIVVSIIVGSQNKVELPTITDADGLRLAISQIGGIAADRLLAIEVLWTPQAEGDTLSADDLVAEYPQLRLV